MICEEGLPHGVTTKAHPHAIAETWFPGRFVLFRKGQPCGHTSSLGEAYALCRKLANKDGSGPTIFSPYDRAPSGLIRGRGIIRRTAGHT